MAAAGENPAILENEKTLRTRLGRLVRPVLAIKPGSEAKGYKTNCDRIEFINLGCFLLIRNWLID